MSWITITEADLLTGISGPELEALRSAALAEDQDDPIPQVIANITDRIRGEVASCNLNTLGPAGTIPKRLLGAAISLLVMEIMRRPGASIIDDPSKSRAAAADKAERLLERVAKCDYRIEDPAAGPTDSPVSVAPRIRPKTRVFDRASQDGI